MGKSVHGEKAWSYRQIEEPHHNCAQSVFMAFAEEAGLSEADAYRIAQNFGGGMKNGLVCGAITGALMALGLNGMDDPDQAKAFSEQFKTRHNGTVDCARLLEINEAAGRDKKEHCDGLVRECAACVEEILSAGK